MLPRLGTGSCHLSNVLLLTVFGNLSLASNVSFYFMKSLEVVSSVHHAWCGVFVSLFGGGLCCCVLGVLWGVFVLVVLFFLTRALFGRCCVFVNGYCSLKRLYFIWCVFVPLTNNFSICLVFGEVNSCVLS